MICECPLHDDIRNSLFEKAKRVVQNFDSFKSEEKIIAVLSNRQLVRITVKILSRKRSFTNNQI